MCLEDAGSSGILKLYADIVCVSVCVEKQDLQEH